MGRFLSRVGGFWQKVARTIGIEDPFWRPRGHETESRPTSFSLSLNPKGARAKTSLPMRDVPEADRPRERLLEQGAQALADAELLAVLLRTGRSGASALEVAREL